MSGLSTQYLEQRGRRRVAQQIEGAVDQSQRRPARKKSGAIERIAFSPSGSDKSMREGKFLVPVLQVRFQGKDLAVESEPGIRLVVRGCGASITDSGRSPSMT